MPAKNYYKFIKNAVKQAIRESETLEEAEQKVDALFEMNDDD
jgi:hypothetical protein